jgi:hypothetical protein
MNNIFQFIAKSQRARVFTGPRKSYFARTPTSITMTEEEEISTGGAQYDGLTKATPIGDRSVSVKSRGNPEPEELAEP